MEKKEKSLIEQKLEEKKKIKKTNIVLIVIGVLIILVEQIVKIFISSVGNITVIPGVLELSVTQNMTAAYGVGSNSTVMYVITNLIVLGIIFKF